MPYGLMFWFYHYILNYEKYSCIEYLLSDIASNNHQINFSFYFQDKRFHEFVNSKKEIIKLFSEMEKSPETEFARDVVCESDSTFQLSTENMKALKVLKVEVCNWTVQL